jgi:DNA transformation protein
MPKSSEFVEHVVESLRGFGAVEARSMFGGWGLYHEGLFFALVADDVLYLKADDENRAEFDARGLEPWVFAPKHGQRIVTQYRQAPEEGFEDAAVMAKWARSGYGAALRAAAKKSMKGRRSVAAKPAKALRRPRKG